MNILAIETSSKIGSLSVWRGDSENHWIGNRGISRSEDLLPAIEQILHKTSLAKKDLDVVAVSNGPGSFTGLRVGIGLAQGLALALETKCLGVSILEAMALAAGFGESQPFEVTSLVFLAQNNWGWQDFIVENEFIRSQSNLSLGRSDELFQRMEDSKTGKFAVDLDTYQKILFTSFETRPENLRIIGQNLATWIGFRAKELFKRNDDFEMVLPNYLL